MLEKLSGLDIYFQSRTDGCTGISNTGLDCPEKFPTYIYYICPGWLRAYSGGAAQFLRSWVQPLVSNIENTWCICEWHGKVLNIVNLLTYIWVRSQRSNWLVTWFCYQLIAKSGNKWVAPLWPDPYIHVLVIIVLHLFTGKNGYFLGIRHCKNLLGVQKTVNLQSNDDLYRVSARNCFLGSPGPTLSLIWMRPTKPTVVPLYCNDIDSSSK